MAGYGAYAGGFARRSGEAIAGLPSNESREDRTCWQGRACACSDSQRSLPGVGLVQHRYAVLLVSGRAGYIHRTADSQVLNAAGGRATSVSAAGCQRCEGLSARLPYQAERQQQDRGKKALYWQVAHRF